MRGIAFREVMEGRFYRNESRHPFRFELRVSGPTILRFPIGWRGTAVGRVHIGGFVEGAEARGTLEINTLVKRRIHYVFDFTGPSGDLLRFDGMKKIRFLFLGWRRLDGAIYDQSGAAVGAAELRFSYRKHFVPFVKSFRAIRRPAPASHW